MPKISALTSLAQADVVTTTDVLPIVDATAPATTKKVTVQAMVNAGLATLTTLPSGIVNASLTSVGTLTALTVSGTSTLGITRVSGADASSPLFGVSGTTRGVRFNTSSFGSSIEGVDNTMGASYQPLNIVASVLGLYTTGGNAIALGTSLGTPQMYVTNTTSAVNFIQATGAATTGAPSFAVGGTDANVSFAHYTKGTGTHQFFANGGLQMLIGATASPVNYWQFFGAAAAGALNMYADGSDTNIAVVQNTKGTGSHFFRTNGGAQTQLRIDHTASAVNFPTLTGSATGGYIGFAAAGSDTNIGITYTAKGTGTHDYYARNGINFRIGANADSAVNYFTATGGVTGLGPVLLAGGSDTNVSIRYRTQGTGSHQFETGSSGNVALLLNHTATAVNYYAINGGATGVQPGFAATGSDVSVSSAFTTKGTGAHFFSTNTYGSLALAIVHTASAVNYAQITGAATGNAPAFSVAGSDSNIDFALTTKGTGVLRFGTHSALAAETVTGYITIKDSAGNTRKLAVVS